MVLPAVPFVKTGRQAIDTVSNTLRGSKVALSECRIMRPLGKIDRRAYKAVAARDQSVSEAYCNSTYRRLLHEQWHVVQRQQTLPPLARPEDRSLRGATLNSLDRRGTVVSFAPKPSQPERRDVPEQF